METISSLVVESFKRQFNKYLIVAGADWSNCEGFAIGFVLLTWPDVEPEDVRPRVTYLLAAIGR